MPIWGSIRRTLSRAWSGLAGISQGSIGFGAGGPVWLDAFRSKRPPLPTDLVNSYKAVAFACVQLNANGLCKVPLRLYAVTKAGQRRPGRGIRSISTPVDRRTRNYLQSRRHLPHLARALAGAEEVDEVFEHPFLDALNCPNDYFDGNLQLHYLARCLDVVGVAYLFPVRPDPSVASSEWYPLHAQYVFPIKGMGEEVIKSYQYFNQTFTRDEVVRIRNVSVRDPYMSPYSPMHACFEQLGLVDYYTAVVESMLKTGARPSMIVGPKNELQPWGEEERKRVEIDINKRFGQGRQGHVWVINGSFTATPMEYPPADLAGLQISKEARLLIANCMDVPISLLQSEDSNRATAQESTYQHQYYAIEPRCRIIAGALTKYLARPVDERLFFEFDDAVERDIQKRATVVDMQVKNGTRTINETRQEDGVADVPWGDEPWFSQTMVQPSAAAEAREQQAEARDKAAEQAALPKPAEPDPAAATDDRSNAEQQTAADEAEAEAENGRRWRQVARVLDRIETELES